MSDTITIFEEYRDRRNEIAYRALNFIQEHPQIIAGEVAEKLMREGQHEATEEEIKETAVNMVAEAYILGEEAGVNASPVNPLEPQVDVRIIPAFILKIINWYIRVRVTRHIRKLQRKERHHHGETQQQSY